MRIEDGETCFLEISTAVVIITGIMIWWMKSLYNRGAAQQVARWMSREPGRSVRMELR